MADEAYGFTPADRDTLTTLRVELGHLVRQVDGMVARITKLEESKVTARDLEEYYTDLDEVREKVKSLGERLDSLERWRWMIAGGAAAVFGLVELAVHVLKR